MARNSPRPVEERFLILTDVSLPAGTLRFVMNRLMVGGPHNDAGNRALNDERANAPKILTLTVLIEAKRHSTDIIKRNGSK